METSEIYDSIIEFNIATEEEILLVSNINGTSIKTLNDIIYARTGYHSIEDYIESVYGVDDC